MKIKLNKPQKHVKNDINFIPEINEEDSEINENIDEYSYLIKTLQKSRETRTKEDQSRINSYLCNNIEFIKNYTKHIDEETLQKITGLINYDHFPSDYKIYSYGDEIDKLYMILKGSISIIKPVTTTKSMSLRDYVEYLQRIREIEKDEMKFQRIQDYNKKVNRFKLISIDYDHTQIPESDKEDFIIEEEKTIDILKEGNIFGEINLVKEKKRDETAVTKEECDIASLDRNEFFKLKFIEEQKINDKVADFRIDFPLLMQWSNQKLSNLIRRLSDENFQKGDLIYKQNDKPGYIYFLKEGQLEVYNNTKFNMYEDFVEYIHDGTNSLCNIIDNPFLWEEDKIKKRIKKAYEDLDYLKFIIKKEKSDEDEDINDDIEKKQEEDENKKRLVEQMEYINNNMKNFSYKANIQKYIAPQVFGYLEAIELKRRFCTIKCISNSAIISKIPIMNFLLLIPTNRNNIINLQKLIFEEKKNLIEQVKNNALAKLTFINSNNQKKKIINLYNLSKSTKGSNNKFKFTKSIKFRSEPNFALSTKNVNKNAIISFKNSYLVNIIEKPLIKQNKIIHLTNKLKFEKFSDKMVNKFKMTMINLNRKEFNVIKKLYPKSVKHSYSNSNFTFTNKNFFDNSYIKLLEKNNNRINENYKNLYGTINDSKIKNHNLYTNLNFFSKIKPRKTRNLSLNGKFLLPGINKSKI